MLAGQDMSDPVFLITGASSARPSARATIAPLIESRGHLLAHGR
jgi:hypothetical protein